MMNHEQMIIEYIEITLCFFSCLDSRNQFDRRMFPKANQPQINNQQIFNSLRSELDSIRTGMSKLNHIKSQSALPPSQHQKTDHLSSSFSRKQLEELRKQNKLLKCQVEHLRDKLKEVEQNSSAKIAKCKKRIQVLERESEKLQKEAHEWRPMSHQNNPEELTTDLQLKSKLFFEAQMKRFENPIQISTSYEDVVEALNEKIIFLGIKKLEQKYERMSKAQNMKTPIIKQRITVSGGAKSSQRHLFAQTHEESLNL